MFHKTARNAVAAALIVCMCLIQTAHQAGAADKVLTRLNGTVGHKADPRAELQPLSGQLALPDNEYAVTLGASQGLLALPDSSQVTLGSNTTVQVGAFNTSASDGDGATLTLNNGTLRFKVVRPPGGKSNYRFTTATSSTSVRGTTAAISSDPQSGDTIACIDCAPGDVVVTVNKDGRAFTLTTGQVIKISLAGIVIGAALAAVASQFAGAGVSMSASSATGAAGAGAGGASAGGAAGAGSAAGAGGAAAGISTTAVVAGTVAVAAAAAVVSNNSNPGPTPIPQQSGTITVGAPQTHAVQNVKPSPTPSPTPKGVKP